MSSAMFRTGLRAPHGVLAGAMMPAGIVLVTPALNHQTVWVFFFAGDSGRVGCVGGHDQENQRIFLIPEAT